MTQIGSASDQTITRTGCILAIVVGAALAIWTLAKAFSSQPPALPLTIGLLIGATLEIVLGSVLYRGSRAARSFLMSLNGVAALAGVLALPAFQRAGVHVVLAGSAVACVAAIVVLLVTAGDRTPPAPPTTT